MQYTEPNILHLTTVSSLQLQGHTSYDISWRSRRPVATTTRAHELQYGLRITRPVTSMFSRAQSWVIIKFLKKKKKKTPTTCRTPKKKQTPPPHANYKKTKKNKNKQNQTKKTKKKQTKPSSNKKNAKAKKKQRPRLKFLSEPVLHVQIMVVRPFWRPEGRGLPLSLAHLVVLVLNTC